MTASERAHQAPTVRPHLLHLILRDNSPHAPRHRGVLIRGLPERELEFNGVRNVVVQLDEPAAKLVEVLEGIMAGTESEGGMQRCEGPPARREREEVAVPISMALSVE